MTKTQRTAGFSLVNLMISVFLLSVMLAGSMNLLSYVSTSTGKANNDELLNQITRLTEVFGSRVSRGGAYLDEQDAAKGIQLCALNNAGTQCSTYKNQTQNFCITLATQVNNGALAKINIKAFRLLNGTLQQREQGDPSTGVNLNTFNIASFCQNNSAWENLHNPDDFNISSLRLCQFKADSFSTIKTNYSTNCSSVLTSTALPNAYWIALFAVTPKKIGADTLQQSKIIQLFNDTIVSSL
jgi:type II secretory pathway component PulJ